MTGGIFLGWWWGVLFLLFVAILGIYVTLEASE